jgi:hypothetical protein
MAVDRYPFKCECGSAFMTRPLLDTHKANGACKPNQVYTLNVRVKPRLHKKPADNKCKACGGKGYCVLGKTKDSKGTITMPCPHNCQPAKDEYEQFVRDCWAQVGTGKPGTYP